MFEARQGYSGAAKAIHWLIAVLILLQFVISVLMPDIGPKATSLTLINLHFSVGLLLLILTAIRLANRWRHPVPLDTRDSPAWERRAARATHRVFYFILLVGPFLGWASASAHRMSVTLFGLFTLPDLAQPRARWALTAGDVHAVMMWTLLGLVALHAAAALYHHFVRRDGVLLRMWPAGAQ